MDFWNKIHPAEKLKNLRWFDMVILSIILWGHYIKISTELYLDSLINKTSEVALGLANYHFMEAAYTNDGYYYNLKTQGTFLVIAFIYLLIRNYDFKQAKIKFTWSVLLWFPFIFLLIGIFSDILYSIFEDYNYLSWENIQGIDWTFKTFIQNFLDLPLIAIIYGIFNGFYEEYFFLVLLTSVEEKYKWRALLFSTIVRISFHTYQGMASALIIGVFFGLFYYILYKNIVKNLLPVILGHAITDMLGANLIPLIYDYSKVGQ